MTRHFSPEKKYQELFKKFKKPTPYYLVVITEKSKTNHSQHTVLPTKLYNLHHDYQKTPIFHKFDLRVHTTYSSACCWKKPSQEFPLYTLFTHMRSLSRVFPFAAVRRQRYLFFFPPSFITCACASRRSRITSSAIYDKARARIAPRGNCQLVDAPNAISRVISEVVFRAGVTSCCCCCDSVRLSLMPRTRSYIYIYIRQLLYRMRLFGNMSIGEDVYKLRGLQMVLRTGAGNFCILGFDKLWIGYNEGVIQCVYFVYICS